MALSATLPTSVSTERPASKTAYRQLCDVIPGGVNSPVRAFKGLGQTPMVVARGAGDLIWDVDGYRYIDYCGSWGALVHGHAHPHVVASATEYLHRGSSFGITTEIEGKLARRIAKHMPSIEMLRFVSTGTEATMSAVRLARGYTGRNLIVKYAGNFHGHADGFLIQAGSGVFGNTPTSSSAGIPAGLLQYTVSLPYNDIEASRHFLREHGGDVAAVILEPIVGNMGVVPADPLFLAMLREETAKQKTLLICDEVMTGFRVSLSGAQSLYGITPDLTCLGKIIGGGFPAAAFGGRREIMELLAPLGPVYQAGTLSGNPVAMAAGNAAIEMLEGPGTYEELQRKTDLLVNPIRAYLATTELSICLQQVGSMFTLFFGQSAVCNMDDAKNLDLPLFASFFRYLFERGIYAPPSQYEAWFVSTVHTDEHLLYTQEAILAFLRDLEN